RIGAAHSSWATAVCAARLELDGYSIWLLFGGKVVELRRTKCVLRLYSVPLGAGVSLFTSLRRALKASVANSVCDIWMVVNGGIMKSANRVSSNPTIDNCWGTLIPSSKACLITPIAVISLEQRRAVGRSRSLQSS